ncbi:hypothetical protein BT63DRAFT_460705 [Microthyrium microscopicum]|uniref:Uncharacterized protein n=1 Tax=Microthyrium microscopicum TaxID=703497 RepID=A0A6A6TZW9_9PEZI|nr:hypothetical protein BT63DRAFT_460705 [Microthyrium microscopicum]
MLFTKTALIALLGFGFTAFAAPVENTAAAPADGCSGSGHYGRCEQGRDQKHQGYREERAGDYRDGRHDVHQGARTECRNGGSCGYRNTQGDHRDIRDHDSRRGRNY